MIHHLSLKNKLLLFWFGSLVSTLLLIIFLFQYMLTQFHQKSAEKQIDQALNALQNRISSRMLQTQKLAVHFSSREEVIASLNLIYHYEDVNNYQAVIFDVEKRNLAQQIGRITEINDLEYAIVQDHESKLVSLTMHADNSVALLHSTYPNTKPIYMQARSGDDQFSPVSALPQVIRDLETSVIQETALSRLVAAGGELHIEGIAPIIQQTHGKNTTLGWVRLIDTLDNVFVNNILQRFNLDYSLQLPNGKRFGSLTAVSDAAIFDQQLPALDINTNAAKHWNIHTNPDHFATHMRIPLSGNKYAQITIAAQKTPLLSALDLFIKVMLFAVFFTVFILAPLGFLFLRKTITAPISQLVDGVKSLGKGGIDNAVHNVDHDELTFLAESVNSMALAITEREAALRESEARVRLLLNSTAEAIYGIDNFGNCTFVNKACLRMLGYDESHEFLGKNVHELIHYKYPDGTQYPVNECFISKSIKKKQGTHIDTEVYWRKDGSSFAVEYWSYPIFMQERCVGAVVTFFDITERKKNESELALYREHLEDLVDKRTQELTLARDQARQASRIKSEFLANMSHELRTPMNSIIGFTGRVIRKSATKLEPRQLNNLHTVERNAHHLLGLINGLLDLSKIEAGKMDTYAEPFDLVPMIQDVFNLTQPMIPRGKPTKLIADLPSEEIMLHTDSIKLKQVLVNLVGNAIKFTHQGSVTVGATLLNTEQPNAEPQIAISVADTGVGISKDALNYIFDAFRQVDGSMSRNTGGTGLGLAIVRSFVALLQGTVSVESKEGVGTRFEVVLPVNLNNRDNEMNVSSVATRNNDNNQRTILCIDNESDTLKQISAYLVDEGYQVVTARSVKQGLLLAKRIKPFAITLNIVMPYQDGWSALSSLKSLKQTRDIPVIVISILQNEALAYQKGAFDCLQQPIKPQRLLSSIARLIHEGVHNPRPKYYQPESVT